MFLYGCADLVSAMAAWALFYYIRAQSEGKTFEDGVVNDHNFWYGLVIVPLAWIIFYWIFDRYRDIYRLSRLTTLGRTFFLSLAGGVYFFCEWSFLTGLALILNPFLSEKSWQASISRVSSDIRKSPPTYCFKALSVFIFRMILAKTGRAD